MQSTQGIIRVKLRAPPRNHGLVDVGTQALGRHALRSGNIARSARRPSADMPHGLRGNTYCAHDRLRRPVAPDYMGSLGVGPSRTTKPPFPTMTIFHMHIRAGSELVRYGCGTEYPNLTHAHAVAIELARELAADAVRSGRDLDADAFVIADSEGKELAVVSFADVLPKSPW